MEAIAQTQQSVGDKNDISQRTKNTEQVEEKLAKNTRSRATFQSNSLVSLSQNSCDSLPSINDDNDQLPEEQQSQIFSNQKVEINSRSETQKEENETNPKPKRRWNEDIILKNQRELFRYNFNAKQLSQRSKNSQKDDLSRLQGQSFDNVESCF